ncbi:MAG: SPOR domain-containing protein [Amoebophilaceae bacterium]|jgi:hypothetical protein|nr:SPOR domain-containing protein [Amoebophilaceae bacterium]
MVDHPTRRHVYLALLLFATATAGAWRKDKPQSTYSENLAAHRRKFEVAKLTTPKPVQIEHQEKYAHVAPIDAVTDQLDYLLARKKVANEHVKYVHGYTIQVYTGGNREEAFKIRSRLHTRYPTMTPRVSYDLPRYTVRVGKFLSKLEAYPTYAAIRKYVPQAIIRPICFPNRPYTFSKRLKSPTPSVLELDE